MTTRQTSPLPAWVLIAGLALSTGLAFPYWTKTTVTFTVQGKERITTGSGNSISSKYLIFTEREVFENTDSIAFLKFDSSDLQGQLKEGQTYTATVYGWRIPALSMYRNIVEVER